MKNNKFTLQNLHMKSSMFMLWLATAVLSYERQIPYIKHIISVLSVMYGRTTNNDPNQKISLK